MDKKPVRISGLHKNDDASRFKECVFCGQVTSAECCCNCRDIAREQITIVAEYLKAHPKANAIEICKNTTISYHNIKGLFEIGWLTIIEE